MRRMHALRGEALAWGLGAIGLGIVGIVWQAFALQWQPVPPALAGNHVAAVASALVLVIGGVLAILHRTSRIGATLLAAWFGLWALALHLPLVVAKHDVGTLLGLAEIGAITAAGLQLALPWRRGPLTQLPPVLFGLCGIVFGVSHFVYAGFTAAMVPGWIPGPSLFWAYATGAGHIAAGLAIATGVLRRLAATSLTVMAGNFVLLLHLPRIIAQPHSELEWTMGCVALTITGAAWIMRGAAARRG